MAIIAGLSLIVITGCRKEIPPPDPETRTMGYDLLAQSATMPATRLLLNLLDDSLSMRLDSAEVSGLDNSIQAWKKIGKEAGITAARFKILGSSTKGITVRDTGIVRFTLSSPVAAASRDTLLTFIGIWNRSSQGWRLGYVSIGQASP